MDEHVRDNTMDQLAGVMYEKLFIFEKIKHFRFSPAVLWSCLEERNILKAYKTILEIQ